MIKVWYFEDGKGYLIPLERVCKNIGYGCEEECLCYEGDEE